MHIAYNDTIISESYIQLSESDVTALVVEEVVPVLMLPRYGDKVIRCGNHCSLSNMCMLFSIEADECKLLRRTSTSTLDMVGSDVWEL